MSLHFLSIYFCYEICPSISVMRSSHLPHRPPLSFFTAFPIFPKYFFLFSFIFAHASGAPSACSVRHSRPCAAAPSRGQFCRFRARRREERPRARRRFLPNAPETSARSPLGRARRAHLGHTPQRRGICPSRHSDAVVDVDILLCGRLPAEVGLHAV